MAKFNFHLRASSRGDQYAGSLFIRLIHRRQVKEITTDYRIFPEEWDDSAHALKLSGVAGARTQYLQDTEDRMYNDSERLRGIIAKLEADGAYTVHDVRDLFCGGPKHNTLLAYVDALVAGLQKNGQHRTARAYRTVSRGFVKYHRQPDLRLEQISCALVRQYEQWMKDHGKSMNTISFYMRNLRAIYRKAIDEKIIPVRLENPFKNVYTGVAVTPKRCLTESELKRFKKLDTLLGPVHHNGKAALTDEQRDAYACFMFSFYSRGMSSIDLAHLKKANIRSGNISYCRRKTGGNINLTVLPEMRIILNYFAKRNADSPYVFPLLDDSKGNLVTQYENFLRKQNRHLKELARLAGIDKPLSTHWARHSWATIAKKNGAPIARISEGLGHRDEKTTRIYLDSFNSSAIDEISILVNKMIS